jgi:hypothetical protein
MLAVADGVNSIAQMGIDASLLPWQLLGILKYFFARRKQNALVYDLMSHKAMQGGRIGLAERTANLDPSAFAHWDPSCCSLSWVGQMVCRALASCTEFGSTTLAVGVLDQGLLRTAASGDSAIVILRLSQSSGLYKVVAMTEVKLQGFNTPYQLARLPQTDNAFSSVVRRASFYVTERVFEVQVSSPIE